MRPFLSTRAASPNAVAGRLIAATGLAIPITSSSQTGGACIPVAERTTDSGCFVHAEQYLHALPPGPIYWHIDRFPSRSAANEAREKNGTVVEILDQVWLFTVAGKSWRSAAGDHIANVGPLPLPVARSLMATYMEGSFKPGMQSTVHRHPGTEAWFVFRAHNVWRRPTASESAALEPLP